MNWDKEATNLRKMNFLQSDHIVKFITAFRRGEKGTERYYLMFEWADGGTLRNFWKTYNRSVLTAGLVFSAVRQIEGLANAVCKAHYPDTFTTHFRHGDLKPENILWFKPKLTSASDDQEDIGTLKIADWGLAKEQYVVTVLRSVNTTTKFGTRRYEPPEEETRLGIGLQPGHLAPDSTQNKKGKRRSRLYDIWALGCITLEFIVWLMYGEEGLDRFQNDFRGAQTGLDPFYQIKLDAQGDAVAQVHEAAVVWMDHMANDPVCQPGETALGNLLEIVRHCLLVVDLPRQLGTSFDILDLKGNGNTQSRYLRPRRGSSTSTTSAASLLSDVPVVIASPPAEENRPAPVVPAIVLPSDSDDILADQLRSPPDPPHGLDSEAEPEPPTPLWALGRSGGTGRIVANQLVQLLEEMIKDHPEKDYWLKDEPEPGPPPPFRGPHVVVSHGDSYETEDSAPTVQENTPTAVPGTIPGGLMPPEQTRMMVSSSLVSALTQPSADR